MKRFTGTRAGHKRRRSGLFVLLFTAAALVGCNKPHTGTHPVFPSAADGPSQPPPLPLIPQPAEVQRQHGRLDVSSRTVISVAPGDEQAMTDAKQLAQLLKQSRGLALKIQTEANPSPGSIRLQLDPAAAVSQAEGYVLDVDSAGMRISARDPAGLFYGMVSGWQLLTPDNRQDDVSVPAASIHDWPRFSWRGQHLDVVRHFMDVDTVKEVIDAMALHKLNVLHLHLTDDQGWRIQIKRYPRLTDIGAWRTPPGAGSHRIPEKVGGFYTQDQIRELVAYAAAHHISILPEIDLPGHAQAAVAAYPDEVGIAGTPLPAVSVDWGINPYLFNTSPASLDFIRNVLEELLPLFPSPYIHIGGDEAIKDQWQASPQIREQMQQLGIESADAMQGWFNEQLSDWLSAHDKRLIGWDEILEGGLPASATVMSWRGTDGALEAASKGHDVVLAPGGWMYLDSLQSDRSDEPNGRLSVLPLSRVYELDPVPAGLNAEQSKHVLGAQGTLWSEYIPSRWHLQHALFPRLSAIAEVSWSPQQSRNFDDFLQRLPAQLQRYQTLGWHYSDAAFAADIQLQDGPLPVLAGQPAMIVLENQSGHGQIHYSTDGSEPNMQSPRYRAPFELKLPATVKAAVFDQHGQPLAVTRSRRFDRKALLSVDSNALQACASDNLRLRLPLLPDLTAADTPVYNVDLFHACWVWPQAPLDDIAAIRVEAARLPRNFGLAHDQSKVVQYPALSAAGELEVLQGCDGPLLATVPLPEGDEVGRPYRLQAPLPALHGPHDLCLRFTAPITGPLDAIGSVQLIPTRSATEGTP